MKTIMTAVVSLAFAGTLVSAEVLQIKSYADFQGGNKPSPFVKSIPGGVRVTNKGKFVRLISLKQIPIDLKKKYQFSCEYRLVPGSKHTGRFYLAPICFDRKNRLLSAVSQKYRHGSDTVLAAPAPKGAKLIKIKNGTGWVVQYGFAALDIKPKYADFPNFNVAAIAGIKKNGNVWDVTLRTPLAKAYPAGTAVREQCAGATYRYVLSNVQPKTQWVKFSGILSGAKHENMQGYKSAWRLGTVKAGVAFFTNGNVDMELRNIIIREVK